MHPVPNILLTLVLSASSLLLGSAGATVAGADLHDANASLGYAVPTSPPLSPQDQARLVVLENRLKRAQEMSNSTAQAEIYEAIGLLRNSAEQFDEAVSAFTSALALYRRLGDERGEATQLSEIGAIYAQMGMKQDALKFYQQSLPLWRRLDQAREAAMLGRIAEAFRSLGDAEEALHFDKQALSVFIAVNDKSGEGAVLNNIGLAYFLVGKKKKGTEYLNRACAIYHDAGDQKGEARALNNLAVAYSRNGNQGKALATFDLALSSYRRLGSRADEATVLEHIGAVYTMAGQLKIAHGFYDRALSIYLEIGDSQGESRTLQELAPSDGVAQPQTVAQSLEYK